MRTPGNDFELAVGFCVSERVVTHPHDIAYGGLLPERRRAAGVQRRHRPHRAPGRPRGAPAAFVSNASCGFCGKTTSTRSRRRATRSTAGRVGRSVARGAPRSAARGQAVFDATGGVHAAALFYGDGELHCLREDIGRHNALDKVIGWAALARRCRSPTTVLLVSGRMSFEIVQKAADRRHPCDRRGLGAVEPRGADRARGSA